MPATSVFSYLIILALGILIPTKVIAQCSLIINNFPYHEDFENNSGGWTTGGTGNDWAWGNPNKPTINIAGSGANCWVTGGLTGSFYNLGARSWVESPCFDFSVLSHPYISFKIWWESEQRYDGVNLQYSLDDGTTWKLVGSATDPANCMNENWFNTGSVTHLSGFGTQQDGWSGTIQPTIGSCLGGQGSKGWVTARHCMPYLAHKPNVRFRFAFGAGTTCNDFDGIAFDDIHIENAPLIAADFDITCLAPDTFQFTSLASNCPDTWSWGFSDPGSGAFNTSIEENPIHVFSKPGIYDVTMQASSTCSSGSSITRTVYVLGLSGNSIPVDCYGNNSGSASVQVEPANGNPTFLWNTNPLQTSQTATNLTAGTYTVTVTEPGTCPTTASVTVTQPEQLIHSATIQPAFCGNPTGSASIQISGGVRPYQFTWHPTGGTDSSAQNLPIGSYVVSVLDKNNCTDTVFINIDSTGIQAEIAALQNVRCYGETNGSAAVIILAGTAPYQYNWPTSSQNSPIISGATAGTYIVTITDANSCTTSLEVVIDQPEPLQAEIQTGNIRCHGAADGFIYVDSTGGGIAPYTYALGQLAFGTNPFFNDLEAGSFILRIQDANGCRFADTLELTEPTLLSIQAGPDTTIFQGGQVLLGGKVSDPGRIVGYLWEPSEYLNCDTCLNTLAMPPESTLFVISATDSSGCIDRTAVKIQVEPAPLFIPNVFAPGSGQQNARFTVFAGKNVEQVELLQVYDRWGSLLFEKQHFAAGVYNEGWDGFVSGKEAPPGIYLYLIRLRFIDKSTQVFSGDLLLVR